MLLQRQSSTAAARVGRQTNASKAAPRCGRSALRFARSGQRHGVQAQAPTKATAHSNKTAATHAYWSASSASCPPRGALAVAPSGQAGPAARARVVARGILDSYRQQQGQQQKGPTTTNNSSGGSSKKPTSSADEIVSVVLEDGDETLSVDDTPCATDCVLDITTEEELEKILASAAAGGAGALVVVDWYKTDCPACRAMAPAYARLCRAASEAGAGVVFAKSNVYGDSEEDGDPELTPLARRYRVKSVPLFTFHRGGEVVESFATRDKARLQDAVARHSPPNTAKWADE